LIVQFTVFKEPILHRLQEPAAQAHTLGKGAFSDGAFSFYLRREYQ
jgi:hypothetical protein